MTLIPRVIELLKERGAEDVIVGGGIIPDADIEKLKKSRGCDLTRGRRSRPSPSG